MLFFKKSIDKCLPVCYTLIKVREDLPNKRKEEKKMMVNFCISNEWFEEIKELIHYENPEYITTGYCSGHVEVDVEEEEFRRVSRALGWML